MIGLHGAGVSTAISTSMAADTVSISTGNGQDLAVELDRGVLSLIGLWQRNRVKMAVLVMLWGGFSVSQYTALLPCTSVPL